MILLCWLVHPSLSRPYGFWSLSWKLTFWLVLVSTRPLLKYWFPLIILRNIYNRAFIFYMLIGLDIDMIPIDNELIISKVKVIRISFVKIWFLLIILRTFYHRAFIYHINNCLVKGLTLIDFIFLRSKVKVTRVNLDYAKKNDVLPTILSN